MTGDNIVGTVVELEVGPVAHGGHCVARHEGQVVFVRHALPGELVHARVTEQTTKYLRADAVQVLTPSPQRIEPPCPHAGPGLCGGCDFQHANIVEQRRLKSTVVSDTLRRIGGIERTVVMESPGDEGLGWRTRTRYAVVDGRPGMYAHRSHELIAVDKCLIAHPGTPDVLGERWPEASYVRAVVSSEGKTAVLTDKEPGGRVVEVVRNRRFRVEAAGFWQAHPAAPETLVDACSAGWSRWRGSRLWISTRVWGCLRRSWPRRGVLCSLSRVTRTQ